jgi:hypothetical protein
VRRGRSAKSGRGSSGILRYPGQSASSWKPMALTRPAPLDPARYCPPPG